MADNFSRARELFLHAVGKLPPEEWDGYIAGECHGDTQLQHLAMRFLEVHRQAGSFLESPMVALESQPEINERWERPGYQIGPYNLLQQIGEGGMGVVYLAEQERPVRRKVALKIIKPGMDTRQVIARFEAERQALTLMDHSNIAKVLDAGTTETGRPYFVMELVRGVAITEYCDECHLTTRERLELFLSVCQAVQHAHQKGVIHRDIKPSNVLVAMQDGQPMIKVIDFGVAKAINQRLTEQTLASGFGQMIGTPLYMSPEQAELSPLEIDTRGDIYSLGVLLYELLTGATPFDATRLKEAGFDELRRIIREEEPPVPSARVSTLAAEALSTVAGHRRVEPRRIVQTIRGDLDWIVMKAMEKDRGRRYETANAFALDLQRYLSDEPVQACPPSAGYRVRKFVRRNKSAVAAASLLLLLLMFLGSGIGWAVRDRSARRARVSGQVELILREVDELQDRQKWPAAFSAARRAEATVAGGDADSQTTQRVRSLLNDLEFIDRLEQARMLQSAWVGQAFDSAAADRSYAQAFRDYGVDVDALPVDVSIERLKARPKLTVAVGAGLDAWAGARRNLVHGAAGSQRLFAIARGIDPDSVRDRVRAISGRPVAETADDLRKLAESIDVRTQQPSTIVGLAKNLSRANQLDAATLLLHDGQRFHPGDFWINYDLATILWYQKDYDGAVRFYTAAVSIRPHAVAALNDLGSVLLDQKKLDEAIAYYRKATEIDPEFVYGHSNLGSALRAKGMLDEAADAHRRAIEIAPSFAALYSNLGNVLREQKKLEEADTAYCKAIELDPKNAKAHYGLGNVFVDRGRLDEAIALYRNAIDLDPTLVFAHSNLGTILLKQGMLDAAIAAFQQSIELDPANADAYANLGTALFRQGKLNDAIAAYRKVIELDPNTAENHTNLGLSFAHLSEFDLAIECFQKAIELDPRSSIAYSSLGRAMYEKKRLDEAVAAYRKAIEINPKHAGVFNDLGLALLDQQKIDEAIAAFRKSIELDPTHESAHDNLRAALEEQGQFDEAVDPSSGVINPRATIEAVDADER